MKKTLFIIVLLLVISLFLHIPNYLELNDLIIIDKISVNCSSKIIKYREVIPYKDNNSIDYKYKNYKYKYDNINEFFKREAIYYKKAKIKWNNCRKKEL